MMPALADSDLQKYHNNEEVLKLTALQVIKDFGMFGMDIDFPENVKYAYHELYEQLEPQLQRLLNTNNKTILSLLYQIDIPEIQIRRKASSMPEKPLSEVIAEMVLARELKKVLTRMYFAEHGF